MSRNLMPPNADESELEVIAAIVLRDTALDDACGAGLRPENFRVELHADVFRAALRLRESGVEAFDIVAIHQEIIRADSNRRHKSDELGDSLQNILAETYYTATGGVVYHVGQVIAAAKRRGVKYALVEGLARIDTGADADDVLAEFTQRTDAVLDVGADGPKHIGDALLLVASRPKVATQGLSTGIPEADELLGGLQPGNLIVLAARPGHGKTALAVSVALLAARRGDAALVVSLEMTVDDLALRLLSIASDIDHKRICQDRLDEVERDRLADAQNELTQIPLWIQDRVPLRLTDITANVRVAVRRHGLQLVIVDYLQLIEPADRKVIREQQVAEMSRSLKTLAKSAGIPVLCLAQLNRAVELRDDKRPRLSDLRESGAIEQDADSVLFLHRQAVSDPNADESDATLIIAKNRHGPTGDVSLEWIGSRMEFRAIGQTIE